jgi:hypothetical protein
VSSMKIGEIPIGLNHCAKAIDQLCDRHGNCVADRRTLLVNFVPEDTPYTNHETAHASGRQSSGWVYGTPNNSPAQCRLDNYGAFNALLLRMISMSEGHR